MKYILGILLTVGIIIQANAQCVIEHWSLQKRIDRSDLVIEGKVISQTASWDVDQKHIYTINEIEVYKCFKGNLQSNTIQLITYGGQIGLERHEVNPALSVQNNDLGVFLLTNGNVSLPNLSKCYQPTASTESFILYDLLNNKAFDADKEYWSISGDLYEAIKAITGGEIKEHIEQDVDSQRLRIRALANPVIDSVDLDTVSSGTDMLLTIYGSNFGIVQGNGKVGFKDANFGDGRYYYSPLSASYESWNNSTIKVYVPTRAGTGKIQVVNNSAESGESSFDLNVKWAHTNVLYATSSSDSSFYQPQHIDLDGNGGYIWHMTHNYASNQPAVKAFYRSLETWRCGTGMNWEVGHDTSLTDRARDDVNIVKFDDLGGNTLGRCWSYWSGCFSSTNSTYYWYVVELDIEFDSTYDWHYETSTTPSGKMDFQSVASHELGHGHQLSHVRDDSKMMHYSIGPGDKKVDLSTFDLEGGIYVKNRSVSTSICSRPTMDEISASECQITLPIVAFDISDTVVCPGDDVVLTNQTEGNALTFSWNFGNGSTSSSVGPHTVSYSTAGSKIVRLIVENTFGKDTLERTITVLPAPPASPLAFVVTDTVCLGQELYEVADVTDATNYAWTVSTGGSFIGGSTGKQVTINWTTGGDKTIGVTAENSCGSSAITNDEVYVVADPQADFSEQIDGLIVDFTSLATDAETHSWDFGDGTSSIEIDPTHQYGDKGSYLVKLVVENRCGKDSIEEQISVNFRVGVEELENASYIHPNPAKSGAIVDLNAEPGSELKLYDHQGRLIETTKLLSTKYRLPKLVDGLYVITIQGSTANYTAKLLIRNN